jgi:hypothetical protein
MALFVDVFVKNPVTHQQEIPANELPECRLLNMRIQAQP